MMKKIILTPILLLAFSLLVSNFCFAQPVSSTELINNAKNYDGKTVAYSGEVIGDIMKRGEYAWVNVSDGQAALGIWLPKDLTRDILYSGSFKFSGDWIEVAGIFQRACPQHGGDLDIHAQALRRISSGKLRIERINTEKRNFIFILSGILCLVLILRQSKQR